MDSTASSNPPINSTHNTTLIESQSVFDESLVAPTTKNVPTLDVAHATTTNVPANATIKDLSNAKKPPSGKLGSQTSKWKLHKKILSFISIRNHSGDVIEKCIKKHLLEWGIDKVVTIMVDNASANDVDPRHKMDYAMFVIDEVYDERKVEELDNLVKVTLNALFEHYA
ncbi:hypothetical protein REPUB_Repub17cG0068700 [Reevesia pubescens]